MAANLPQNMQHAHATYTVFKLIKEGKNAAQIALILSVSRSTISRKLKRFLRAKLIAEGIRSSFGKELFLTPAGTTLFNEMQHLLKGLDYATLGNKQFKVAFRRHHVLLRMPILKRQIDADKIFQDHGAAWQRRGPILGWVANIDGHPVMLTGKSILIWEKPIWGNSVWDVTVKAFKIMDNIQEKLKLWCPYLELAEKTELCRQHLAMVGGFTELIPSGYKYKSDRLMIDYSTGVAEIESIHSQFSTEDMNVLMAHFEALIRDEWVKKKDL